MNNLIQFEHLIFEVTVIVIALQLGHSTVTALRTGIFTWSHPLSPSIQRSSSTAEPFDYWLGVVGSMIFAGWLFWLAAGDV